jgi:hypothetical protein
MNSNITHYNSIREFKNETVSMKKTMFGPTEKTLDLIRQFARVYHFEPALEQSLGSFIVN